ncbi:hypothetical protein [Tuberibacillus calidus]|jgi:hypothetical protein|nr:hypothetical protein [Tuberibacillus calidus]
MENERKTPFNQEVQDIVNRLKKEREKEMNKRIREIEKKYESEPGK